MSHQVSITRGFGIETPSNGAGGRQGPSPASCWELGLCQHREPYLGQKPSDAAEDGAWFVVSSAPSVSTGGSRLYLLRVQKRKRGKRKKKKCVGEQQGEVWGKAAPPLLAQHRRCGLKLLRKGFHRDLVPRSEPWVPPAPRGAAPSTGALLWVHRGGGGGSITFGSVSHPHGAPGSQGGDGDGHDPVVSF